MRSGQFARGARTARTTAIGGAADVRTRPAGVPFVAVARRRAAELQGRSVSDFVVAAALKDAQRTIEDAQIVRLSVEDQRRFAELVLNPPPLAPAMKRALGARKQLIADTK